MTRDQVIIGGALAIALAIGTWKDTAPKTPRLTIGGYEVLATDFHVHPHPLAASALPPWDLVGQARRVHLDAMAVTPHNIVWVGRVARWFSERSGGPIVMIGEEVANPRFHLLAVGVEHTIAWHQSSASVLADVHAQGGIAIAAHPTDGFQDYSDETAAGLDGTEIMHPLVYGDPDGRDELRAFNTRAHAAVIGDSDFHGIGQLGMCRTYVFVRERSAAAIIDAVRNHRTVVYDGDRAYGDPALVALANEDGRLRTMAADAAAPRRVTADCVLALAALFAALIYSGRVPGPLWR